MFKFPTSVRIELKSTAVEFKIVEITEGIYALRNHMHAMNTQDDFTFGYIVFRDSHLYAYAIMDSNSSKGYQYKLIFLAYIGPEEDIDEEMEELSLPLFRAIGCSVIQVSRHEMHHPAILDRDRFDDIYDEIMKGLQEGNSKAVTPFVKPIHDLAVELRDFLQRGGCCLHGEEFGYHSRPIGCGRNPLDRIKGQVGLFSQILT